MLYSRHASLYESAHPFMELLPRADNKEPTPTRARTLGEGGVGFNTYPANARKTSTGTTVVPAAGARS